MRETLTPEEYKLIQQYRHEQKDIASPRLTPWQRVIAWWRHQCEINEHHLAIFTFLIGVMAVFTGIFVKDEIYRAYAEMIGDIGLLHACISLTIIFFGTVKVPIVDKILNSDIGVSIFFAGYVLGVANIIAG